MVKIKLILLHTFPFQASNFTAYNYSNGFQTSSLLKCSMFVFYMFVPFTFFFLSQVTFSLLTTHVVFEGCRGVKIPVAGFYWFEEVRNSGACLWDRNYAALISHLSSE